MIVFEKECGKFAVHLTEEYSNSKVTGYRLQYWYGPVSLKELTFPANKKQVAIDIAAHMYDAVNAYRECIVAKICMVAGVI